MSDDYNVILKPYRAKIDSLDDQIVDLLVQREGVIREVADIKSAHNIPAVIQNRVEEVRERCAERSIEAGMSGNYVREVYQRLIQLSCDLEIKILEKK